MVVGGFTKSHRVMKSSRNRSHDAVISLSQNPVTQNPVPHSSNTNGPIRYTGRVPPGGGAAGGGAAPAAGAGAGGMHTW